jgi:hypothetical protein
MLEALKALIEEARECLWDLQARLDDKEEIHGTNAAQIMVDVAKFRHALAKHLPRVVKGQTKEHLNAG